jgi:hypothetical protein
VRAAAGGAEEPLVAAIGGSGGNGGTGIPSQLSSAAT